MSNVYRRDECVVDSMGNPLSGVRIFLCNQPCNPGYTPAFNGQPAIIPNPLANVYADSAGAKFLDQITAGQQLMTDAYGRCSYFAAQGIYTCVYWSPQINTPTLEIVLPDQIIVPPVYGADFNSDSSANGTIHPAPDGVNRAFDLSQIPNVPNSLVIAVNGITQTGWTLVYATVSLLEAPQPGDVITARYVVP